MASVLCAGLNPMPEVGILGKSGSVVIVGIRASGRRSVQLDTASKATTEIAATRFFFGILSFP
jgi:hypothetical protein